MADNRGGVRSPTPGQLYPNRGDMASQPANAPRGQTYGKAGAQLASQATTPVAGSSTPSPDPNSPEPGMQPGQVPTLQDPSTRPDEPVTAGLPSGSGPGPEALRGGSFGPESLSLMRAVYARYPNDDLRRLIEQTEVNL